MVWASYGNCVNVGYTAFWNYKWKLIELVFFCVLSILWYFLVHNNMKIFHNHFVAIVSNIDLEYILSHAIENDTNT